MRIAVLGLGEAGSIYAEDLALRGATVTAADPLVAEPPPGVVLAGSVGEAVAVAEAVLSLVTGRASAAALAEALPAMAPGAVFADMNTAGPEHKRELARRAEACGLGFADVAILAPVPRGRLGTPLLASGSGAERLVRLLACLGVPATAVGPEAGTAAGLKLLRSVFMKGLAAAVFEAVDAAQAIGARAWVVDQIASELGPQGPALVERILEGTPRHATRREAEMREARAFLDGLGAAHPLTDATIEWLHALAEAAPPSPSKIVDNLVSDP
jgi:3-hydroxyisobutyrate dehydrogenase-like beta-hydroxyacid dehydrogenase